MLQIFKLFHKYYLSTRPNTAPVRQSDFEMYIEDFDLNQYKKDIYSFQNQFSIQILQTITYKEELFEIFGIETKQKSAQKKLLIFAAVHGNEFASALVVPEMLSDIATHSDFYKDWNIRIVAPVNPVGLQYQSRYNEDGYDINRDFKNYETAQAKLQRCEVEIFRPDIILSLHEHPYDGFMIICTRVVPQHLQDGLLADLKNKNILLWKDRFLFKIPGTQIGIIREGFFINALKFLFGIYTFGRYAMNKNIGVITSESSWKEKSIEKRILGHMICLKGIITHY